MPRYVATPQAAEGENTPLIMACKREGSLLFKGPAFAGLRGGFQWRIDIPTDEKTLNHYSKYGVTPLGAAVLEELSRLPGLQTVVLTNHHLDFIFGGLYDFNSSYDDIVACLRRACTATGIELHEPKPYPFGIIQRLIRGLGQMFKR